MSSVYLHFSEAIDDLTPEEETWLREALRETREMERLATDGCPEMLEKWKDNFPFLTPEALNALTDEFWPHFLYSFEDTSEGGRRLWIRCDGQANVEHIEILVRAFLLRFRPDQCWTMTWAETAHRPTRGAFHGGWIFVTAEGVEGGHTWNAVEKRRHTFENPDEPGGLHDERKFVLVNVTHGASGRSDWFDLLPGEEPHTYTGLVEVLDDLATLAIEHGHDLQTARVFELAPVPLGSRAQALLDEKVARLRYELELE
jgi:hypothetical protein